MEVITFDNLPHVDIKYCQNCEQGPNIKWTWNFKQGMSGQGEETSNKLSKRSYVFSTVGISKNMLVGRFDFKNITYVGT